MDLQRRKRTSKETYAQYRASNQPKRQIIPAVYWPREGCRYDDVETNDELPNSQPMKTVALTSKPSNRLRNQSCKISNPVHLFYTQVNVGTDGEGRCTWSTSVVTEKGKVFTVKKTSNHDVTAPTLDESDFASAKLTLDAAATDTFLARIAKTPMTYVLRLLAKQLPLPAPFPQLSKQARVPRACRFLPHLKVERPYFQALLPYTHHPTRRGLSTNHHPNQSSLRIRSGIPGRATLTVLREFNQSRFHPQLNEEDYVIPALKGE
ncbi:hypothetical protein BDZ89DRAFT_1054483, partial [Hymenopellis radicata]